MKSKISKDEVVALARLTKLDLTADEIEQYTEEISSLLTYFEQLDKLDLNTVNPTISVGAQKNVTRADVVGEQVASPDELKSVLPRQKDGYIQVERMI